jgi:hypothetical protein
MSHGYFPPAFRFLPGLGYGQGLHEQLQTQKQLRADRFAGPQWAPHTWKAPTLKESQFLASG